MRQTEDTRPAGRRTVAVPRLLEGGPRNHEASRPQSNSGIAMNRSRESDPSSEMQWPRPIGKWRTEMLLRAGARLAAEHKKAPGALGIVARGVIQDRSNGSMAAC